MEWNQQVHSIIGEYKQHKKELTAALNKVLSELEVQPFGYVTEVKSEDSPIKWTVSIGKRGERGAEFDIIYRELENEGGNYDDNGEWIKGFPEDVEEAFRKIIVKRLQQIYQFNRR
ncbi:hypothetical protein YDYSY3_57720 [Paenibacillus chitinolyticus]|uniref:hypothetical protein n=1 Tax=Paenibacillus chitinolyticus TaxID=79263 RepID=UPI0026E4EB14|nr:hypothetical protein [Paenibacillus chitinolyticus]GKS14772.1 hypothetical protein YDYSY3_57720 [Paenibacillus chitinolyticus]